MSAFNLLHSIADVISGFREFCHALRTSGAVGSRFHVLFSCRMHLTLLMEKLLQLERERERAAQHEDRRQASRDGRGWEGLRGSGWSGLITREARSRGWMEYSPTLLIIARADHLCLSRSSTLKSLQPSEQR